MSTATAKTPAEVARVADALAGLGCSGRPRQLSAPAHTAAAAAELLGVDVSAIGNSLVFAADGAPLLAITSGAHRADPLVLAAVVGVNEVRVATRREVTAWTGQPPGGVAPVGHPAPIRALVDVELSNHQTVWCGAGHPDWVFPTNYAELLRVTAGEAAEVGDLDSGG